MGSDQERLTAGVADAPRVAYVVSRFPKITETFVLREMLALEELGFRVELFPLLRHRERVVHAEAEEFVRRAHHAGPFSREVVSANLRSLWRSPVRYLATLLAVLWRTLPSPRFFAGAIALFPKAVHFARAMQRLGVEHVHAHFASHAALAALVVHRLSGIPFSFTAHGSDLHVDQTALGWKLREAAWAVTVSEYNREFVRARLGDEAAGKLLVIRCGVDSRRLVRGQEPATTPFEILCVAALRGVKGHVHLIEACRLLRDRGVGFRCHLVGSGPKERELRRQVARRGLEGAILFHGALAHADVLARMRAAHVVALCSVQDGAGRREGVPVVLMEAMSCELPVVASRISGIPELVRHGHSGLLTPPGDATAIADALEQLARSPAERRRLGQAGRATVVREFELRRTARQIADAIARSCRERRRTAAALALAGREGSAGIADAVPVAGLLADGARHQPVALAPDGVDPEAAERPELRA